MLNISTGLISKDSNSLIEALSDALARLGNFSGADRCYVFVYDADGGTMSNTHEWCRDGITPQRDHLQKIPVTVWPYWMEQLERDGIVDWPRISALPAVAAAEKEALMEQGVLSLVAVSIIENEGLIGFVGFDSVASERFWKSDEIYLLRLSANVISGAITRLRSERDLRKMREQLMHATQLESLGRFVGGTAHDFNNLLTIILGNCELSESATSNDELRDYVTEIRESAEKAAILTRNLLAFGRRHVIERKVIDINQFVLDTMSFLERILGESIQLDVALLPDPAYAFVDDTQLQNALLNLAANARDAMPSGGELTIRCQRIDADSASPAIQIELTDTGHGMDATTLDQAFDPFFTTKPVDLGSGLGLSSVHGIIVQNEGSVNIGSIPGTGTTVRIEFPEVSGETASSSAATTPLRTSPLEGEVLIIEDEPAVREVLGGILRRTGLTITTAESGNQAIEMLATDRNKFDLVITDIVMPGMSGLELIKGLRVLCPKLPVIAMSGYSEDAIALAVQDKKNLRLFAKPIDHGELIKTIRDYLT
ncbi:MAG: response regulator [Gammaproteobacteria bacterium]|nr:response regulator [Gammaproteobacteria bacterium]